MNSATQFWNWFKENNKSYLFLNSIDLYKKEKLLEEFEESLHKYCNKLFFEIGGPALICSELIITAEGNKNYFKDVECLIGAAPAIEGWEYFAFKQPIPGHFTSQWEDLELDTKDMWFLPLSNNHNTDLGIRILFKNYDTIKDNKILMTVLYKMMDTILGEKLFAQDIQYLDTGQQPFNPASENMFPILDLPDYIVWHKSNVK